MSSTTFQSSGSPILYSCTIEHCEKHFLTRAFWEEHETTAHPSPLELWKCSLGKCHQISYLATTHTEHLAQKHAVVEEADVAREMHEAHVGADRFWCGFCRSILDSCKLRMGHVAGHFESGDEVQDWVCV